MRYKDVLLVSIKLIVILVMKLTLIFHFLQWGIAYVNLCVNSLVQPAPAMISQYASLAMLTAHWSTILVFVDHSFKYTIQLKSYVKLALILCLTA